MKQTLENNGKGSSGFVRRLIAIVACVLIFEGLSLSVGALTIPLESRIRPAVMQSSHIFVGRILDTEPFLISDRARVSELVVDDSIYGPAVDSDTLRINWNANSALLDNGNIISLACGQGVELDELRDEPILWVLKEEAGLRCSVEPIRILWMSREQLEKLADIVEFEKTKKDDSSFYNVRMLEIEARQDSIEKRAAFVAFIHNAFDE